MDERKLDFQDTSTFVAALDGIDTLFLMRPPQISNVKKYFHPFLDTVRTKGVHHIIFLSLQGAESTTITPHGKIELYMESFRYPTHSFALVSSYKT